MDIFRNQKILEGDRMTEQSRRKEIGQKISLYMALGNFCLFLIYLVAGILGNSIAVISEGMDNLIDACSSLVLTLGFKISGMGKDELHPNGHGRIEYIAGLLVSELILWAAFMLGKESIHRLLHPEPIGVILPIIVTAVIGAIFKLAMSGCIEKQNKDLKSSALEAYQKNELADLKGIVLVAISPILQHFTTMPIDGMVGLAIAAFIALDGLDSFFKNISLLVGEKLDKEKMDEIMQIVQRYGNLVKLESFEFYDYGPEESQCLLVLSTEETISNHNMYQIVDDCKQQIKERLNMQVFVYVNRNVT